MRDWDPGVDFTALCTSNVGAARNDVDFLGREFRNEVVLTAGHCTAVTDAWVAAGSPNMLIGVVVSSSYDDESKMDLGAIELSDTHRAARICDSHFGNEGLSVNSVVSVQTRTQDVVGESVCMSGASSDKVCGTITSLNYSSHSAGIDLRNQRLADYSRAGGDSGAPVSFGTKIKGIHSGGRVSTGEAVYSHIGCLADYMPGYRVTVTSDL